MILLGKSLPQNWFGLKFVIFTVIFVMSEHKIKEGFVRFFSYIGWDPKN